MSTTTSKTVALKVAGERRATADALFVNRVDLDQEAFASGAFDPATVAVHRQHESVLGGSAPPFGVAKIRQLGNKYVADIGFLDTPRGNEEYQTVKALAEAGVVQPVSVGLLRIATGPVPESLRATGVNRYITRAKFVEISFVGIGAIPGAELTSIKAGKTLPSPAEQRATVESILSRLVKPSTPPTVAQLRRTVDAIDARMAQVVAEKTVVSDFKRQLARKWTDAGCAAWGIPRLRIGWGVGSMKTAGEFRPAEPDAIYLNPTLPVDQLHETCLHEVSHAARFRLGLAYRDERGVERDTAYLMEQLT